MSFKPGDKVSFLNEKGHGIVTEILSSKLALVEMEDGFGIPYPINQLVHFGPPATQQKNETKKTSSPEKLIKQKIQFNDKPVKARKNASTEYWEVDLHIGELVDSYKNLSNSQMLSIQMNYCRKKFEDAIAAGIKKIYFIHGVGNGVLKHEVIKFLESRSGIAFYDAPYRMFGFGATEVVIR